MRSACVVRCMSSLELSSGAGTAAARRRGSARPLWSSAARSDAEPGGRGPASCKHVRSPEARQIECKAAARAAQGAGRTRATHAATRRAPRGRPRQEGCHRTLETSMEPLFPTMPSDVWELRLTPWLFVLVRLALPLASSPRLRALPLSSMGRVLHSADAPRVPSSNAVGLAAEGCLAPFIGHALVRPHSHA